MKRSENLDKVEGEGRMKADREKEECLLRSGRKDAFDEIERACQGSCPQESGVRGWLARVSEKLWVGKPNEGRRAATSVVAGWASGVWPAAMMSELGGCKRGRLKNGFPWAPLPL